MLFNNKIMLSDLSSSDIKDRSIILRVDFNVPIQNNEVQNDMRIRLVLPTINKILSFNPRRILIISHLGRPDGKINLKYSLKPILIVLEKLLQKNILFIEEYIEKDPETKLNSLQTSGIALFENIRFYPEEEGLNHQNHLENKQIELFKQKISNLGDIFINDAFGAMHRAHSSIIGICTLKVAGLLVERELNYFSKIINGPKLDLIILGGSKISGKIKLIEKILPRTKKILIGGGLCFPFLKYYKNYKIGDSICDGDEKLVNYIIEKANSSNTQILFPIDFITTQKQNLSSKSIHKNELIEINISNGINDSYAGFDIGPNTIKKFHEEILNANYNFWNGPMGFFERKEFAHGTYSIVDSLINATTNGSTTIIGGGETAMAVENKGAANKVSHLSTGGGAALELLEGNELPGIKVLSNK